MLLKVATPADLLLYAPFEMAGGGAAGVSLCVCVCVSHRVLPLIIIFATSRHDTV